MTIRFDFIKINKSEKKIKCRPAVSSLNAVVRTKEKKSSANIVNLPPVVALGVVYSIAIAALVC